VSTAADARDLTAPTSYLGEIRAKWRCVAAASLGQASGYSLLNYLNNIFTPHLLKEFNWSRSAFALVGVTLFLGILIQPITGRLGDSFGVRRVAIVGVIGGPLVFIGFTLMTGALWQYFALNLLYLVLTSGATVTVIYSRLLAKNLDRARGIALAVAASAAPAAAAICLPFLSRFIEANGWRAGYRALAVAALVGGGIALLLIPTGADKYGEEEKRARAAAVPAAAAPSLGSIFRSRPMQLLLGAVFLLMMSFTLQTTQLKVILTDHGIDSATGSLAISLFATSTIVGRLLCGLALDRFPAHIVAAVFLGLPGIGLSLLAVGALPVPAVAVAVSLLGAAMGAEGDVWAYLVTRHFPPAIYGMVLGLVLSGMALSSGLGALLLSVVLKLTGSFTPFIILSAVAVFVGSGLLMLLKSGNTADGAVEV
jgi:MFS family permease